MIHAIRMSAVLAVLAVLVVLALVAVVALVALAAGSAHAPALLLHDSFEHANGPGGLITNAYAAGHPDDPRSVRSPLWEVTSGSLFSRRGHGWTGVPDLPTPDVDSSHGTGSAVFRMRSRRRDLRDVAVRLRVRVLAWTRARPAQLPAVVLWVRYMSPQRLYWPSVLRSDGRASIAKKVPGGPHPFNGGTYYALGGAGSATRRPVRLRRWYDVGVVVCNRRDGGVTITTTRDGHRLQRAVDAGVGQRVLADYTGRRARNPTAPLRAPGRVGIRADNAELEFGDYAVTAAGARCREN